MVYTKPEFHKDASKWALMVPQILLSWVNLWPEGWNTFSFISFWVKMIPMILLEMGQMIYFVLNVRDITTVAAAMSTFSTTLQAISKSSVLFIHSKRLKKIVETIFKDFWPSNFMGIEVEKDFLFTSRLAVSSMVMVVVTAFIFATGFLSAPLREGVRTFPFLIWYPYSWKLSPVYEILYVLQCFVNVYCIIISICGHDDLFLAICTNCIAQFKMLKQAVLQIGTEDGVVLCQNLRKLKNEKELNLNGEYLKERELLIKCIEHHRMLIRVYDDTQEVFTTSAFVQLFCSVSAICVSSFLIVMKGKAQMIHLTSYCLGHVLQLFIFCAAANELAYQSQTLTTYIFNSGWYNAKYVPFKKDLVMALQFAQKPKEISALGIVNLNYSTFIGVLRLSFSFYTFLSTIVAK